MASLHAAAERNLTPTAMMASSGDGVIVFFRYAGAPDRPESFAWLSAAEARTLAAELTARADEVAAAAAEAARLAA